MAGGGEESSLPNAAAASAHSHAQHAPPTAIDEFPSAMLCAAYATDFIPDAQTLFTVVHTVDSSNPEIVEA